MRKISLIIVSILFAGNLFAVGTWDILDKDMSAWNTDGGAGNNKAWKLNQGGTAGGVTSQQSGYVNFKKTDAGASGKWAWVVPVTAPAGLTAGTAYSIEVKARVQEINKTSFPDNGTNYEANQIALRLGGLNAAIFLKYGDGVTGGFVSTTSGGTANVYTVNTSQWQVYRIVLHTDHSKYDVYIDGVETPLFENTVEAKNDVFGVCFGAESQHRCNIDIEYVKMGTGDFFSKPKINSVVLGAEGHMTSSNAANLTVTAGTVLINDGEQITFSLVDGDGTAVAGVSPVTNTVSNNQATATLVIPATVPAGQYRVKVNAPGQINGMDVAPATVRYMIAAASEWDIVDKTMTAWDAGVYLDKAWTLYVGPNLTSGAGRYSFTQETGHVNMTKTYATANSNSLSLYTPSLAVSANTAYTYEYSARINQINKDTYPDNESGWEKNLLMARFGNKYTNLYLAYDADGNGYATLNKSLTATEGRVTVENMNDWNLYRYVVSADRTTFDLYVNGVRIFRKAPTTLDGTSIDNILQIGSAEGLARCNIDLAYAKMGTGDFNTIPLIYAVSLDSDSHTTGNPATVEVTVETDSIADGSNLLVSLVDNSGTEVVSETTITVTGDAATGNITIPGNIAAGNYFVKVAVPGGLVGSVTVAPKTVSYVVDNATSAAGLAYEASVSVSASVLKGGQLLSVKADNASLSEAALYGIAGNEIYRHAASGSDFSLNVPTAAGLYVLTVKLDNNLLKEFKILVK